MISERERMVAEQIVARGVGDSRTIAAMRSVPRHLFVPERHRNDSYEDYPLPIDCGQTISQPYIVALMTELLALKGGERVLEIGTGSGYQTAVLAELAREVFSVEIVEQLHKTASKLFLELGYKNIHTACGDGHKGWPENEPYDGIMVTAAPEFVPEALIKQLKPGGRLVIPVGDVNQYLVLYEKDLDGLLTIKPIIPVRFVPMTGPRQNLGGGR